MDGIRPTSWITVPEKAIHRRFVLIPVPRDLPPLDEAAVWTVGALRFLMRPGRQPGKDAWLWVSAFEDLLEQATFLKQCPDPPANCCPLVPASMLVQVDLRPAVGEAIPVEHQERQIGALDNRRLAGNVARVLAENIALYCRGASDLAARADRNDSEIELQRADALAQKALDLGRRTVRGVDLDELDRAVQAEVEHCRTLRAAAASRKTAGKRPERVDVQFSGKELAVVTEGDLVAEVRGDTRVWVFRRVVEAAGATVTWNELVRAKMADAGEEMDRRFRIARREDDSEDGIAMPVSPRMTTSPRSMHRTGSRIRQQLGKLSYHWHQDGQGARWSAAVS